jgi:hypothetical protein
VSRVFLPLSGIAICVYTNGLGGGIVFDSDPYDEWVETMNKLGASMQTISSAEELYTRTQTKAAEKEALEVEKAKSSGAHIDLAL